MSKELLINELNQTLIRNKRWARIEGFSYSENKKKTYIPHYFLRLVSERGYYGAMLVNISLRT